VALLLLLVAGVVLLPLFYPVTPTTSTATLKPDTWCNLLDRSPEELDWTDERGHLKWNYDDRNKELFTMFTALGLLRLGQTSAPRYEFEVAIQQTGQIAPGGQTGWTGGAGVFFGYHDVPSETRFGKKYQSIELRAVPSGNGPTEFALHREVMVLKNKRGGAGQTIRSVSRPVPAAGEHRLGIVVGPGGLERVTWDGQEVSGLVKPEDNKRFQPVDYQGTLGVLNRSATSVFRNARFLFSQSESP
jgi:hypothetical protein